MEHPDDIECKNFKICTGICDKRICYCSQCYWMYHYQTLEIKNNTYCPICLEENQECVKFLNCSHFICIKCYKKQVYPEKLERTDEPLFPYESDIEDEYYDDTENIKWVNDYPLIKIYEEEWNKCDNEDTEKYEDETNLRICSICRK